MEKKIDKKNKNLMALAENARVVNNLDAIGPAGQQVFMHRLFMGDDADSKRRKIRELTK